MDETVKVQMVFQCTYTYTDSVSSLGLVVTYHNGHSFAVVQNSCFNAEGKLKFLIM